MRVAVLGAGRIGTLHARSLAKLAGVEVEVADNDPGRAQALAAELGCRRADLGSLWSEKPAGVVIASPSVTHAALVEAALEAGVGVFCEKPLTTTLSQSVAISERSRETGTPVLVGLQRRFDSAFRGLRAELASGSFGEPYLLRSCHCDTGLPPAGYLGASGSLFLDMFIHDIDAVRWLTGSEVVAVASAGLSLTGDPEVAAQGDIDSAVCTLQLENGSLALLEGLRKSPYGYLAEAEVITATATGRTEPQEQRDGSWMERFAAAFEAQIEGFVAVLRGGEAEGATAADATADLRVALAAEQAYREQRSVNVAT